MGSKLLFRFRSGTHGLNGELGRHITRNISKSCSVFCNCDCESVEHVLWEYPAYSNNRSGFINNLSKILCSNFHLMSAFEKTRYIFDQSIWECNGHFDHWFSNIKSFMCGVWNLHKEKLYPEDFSMNMFRANLEFAQSWNCATQTWNSKFGVQTWDFRKRFSIRAI